jgi:3-oxoacyl-[acyl-carrier-protein] synthase I
MNEMESLAVTGIGMVTPVGYDTAQTYCAVRAGIAAFAELPQIVDGQGNSVVATRLPEPGDSAAGDHRPWAFAKRAWDEALRFHVRQDSERRGLHVSVLTGEPAGTGAMFRDSRSISRFLDSLDAPRGSRGRVYALGNASAIVALGEAQARLRDSPRSIEVLIGLDSLIAPPVLGQLERAGRLKSSSRPRGAIAGEAVSCVVVESRSAAADHGRDVHCWLTGIGVANEPAPVASDEPCFGDGLTTAIQRALQTSRWGGDEPERVYCDLNGEEYRVHEWMLALCRTMSVREIVHPADCVGDVGAAFGPLLIGLAATALSSGRASIAKALVFCSSDGGTRGSVCLRATEA